MLLSRGCSDSLRLNCNGATVTNILTASNMHFPVGTYSATVAYCHSAEREKKKMKCSTQQSLVVVWGKMYYFLKVNSLIPKINTELQAFSLIVPPQPSLYSASSNAQPKVVEFQPLYSVSQPYILPSDTCSYIFKKRNSWSTGIF